MSIVNAKNAAACYPYYGSWFIGLVAEAILFTSVLTYGISPSAFTYIRVTIQACRMLILVLLSTALFTNYSKRIAPVAADEESASLLGHRKGESDDTQASSGKSCYGSITITANGEGADLEYEAEQRRKDRERKERLEKRLQAEGNWFTYGLPPEKPLCSVWHAQVYWPTSARCLLTNIIPSVRFWHGANL